MNNNLNVQVTADLNVTRSVAQINAEIKKIEGQLRYLKLTATLDKGKSNAEIQKQIATLNKQKKQLYVDLKLRQKDLKNQYKQIEKQNKMQLNVDTTTAQRNIANVGTTIKQTASETATLGFALKSALSNAGLVLSAQSALQLVRKAAREATEAIKEYDTYQTNLSVITGGTRADSDDIIADLADKSFEYKVDISELESATETLLRTGKSMEEIEHYLKDTVYLSKIGFQDATESAENLVTIGNAFEYNAEEMENVVDKLLALDTASNTVAGKLATALAKTAQNAKLAGLEIDQLGAIVSGLRDTTGKSEDEIATALNSMTARVYNVKLGKYEMELEDGTTEDITESLNNTERMLKTVGISLRDNKNQFKEIDEIINEIVPKWDEFTNVQQNSIASTFAGTYHRNTFISLIDNWEKIGELIAISADSAGQAATKYSTYIDSIEAKSAALNTSMKELWNGLVTNEFVGNLTDATTGVIKFADEYRVLQNLLKSVTFYAFAKGLVSTKNSLLGIVTDVKNVSTAFVQLETVQKTAKGTELYKSNIKALGTTVSALSDKQVKLLLSTNQLSNSQKVAILHASGLSKKEAELKLQTLGLATTQKTATASTVSLSGSLKALWATISANPIMADYADMIDGINSNIVSLDAPSDYGSSGNSKPTSVTNFEKELTRKQHLINTGKMREDETYYDWLEQAAYTAYSGLANYEDELYKYQEQVYKGRQQLAENYFNERVNELGEYAEKVEKTSVTSDGTKLNSQEKWREIADIYREIQNEIAQRINDIVEIGADSNKELLDELNKQYEEYAGKISDTFRSAVEEEEDLVNAQKDKYSDLYDERIDKVKEQQETMEKAVNSEIEAIDEKIKHLQRTNDEENTALEIEKARQELRKAEQHTRKVYGADGNITYEQDKTAIAEARKNLDELLLEQQITALENEKSVLKSIRDTETEGYNKLIESLESEKEQGEKQFDILLQVLDNYLNPNDSTSNVDVWSKLAKTEGAKYSDGVWRDKDNNVIDIDKMLNSSNAPQIMRAIDIDAWLKKLKASPEFIQGVQSGDSNAVTAKLTDSINANANKQWNDQHKPDFSASRDDYKINNQSQIINNTIGDVHVHNPVKDGKDVANEVLTELTLALERQMYTNIKKY